MTGYLVLFIAVALVPIVALFGYAGCSQPKEAPRPPATTAASRFADTVSAAMPVGWWRPDGMGKNVPNVGGGMAPPGTADHVTADDADPAHAGKPSGKFDGTASIIDVPEHVSTILKDQFTIEAWMKLDKGLPEQGIYIVVSSVGFAPGAKQPTSGWRLRVVPLGSGTSGKPEVGLFADLFPGRPPLLKRFEDDGKWHHVALSLDKGYAQLYFDGISVANASNVDFAREESKIKIGSGSLAGGPPFAFFKGSLDEVALFGLAVQPHSSR
jgi:hypothetical protein